MDEKTGEYNLKYNMQNMLEDFYIQFVEMIMQLKLILHQGYI